MKKINYNLVTFIAAVTVMTSCKEEDVVLTRRDEKAHSLIINVREEEVQPSSITKTAITGRIFTWAAEDTISLYTVKGNTKGAFKITGGQGTNKGTFGGHLTADDERVYAAYPHDDTSTFNATTYTSHFVMSQTQEHLENGALDSTSIGDYALMFGKSKENVNTKINSTTGANISMEHLTAVFDLKLTDIPNNTIIHRLSLSASTAIFPSKIEVDLATGDSILSDKRNNITVALVNSAGNAGVNVGTRTSLTIRLAMLPTTVPNGGTLTVLLTTVNGGTITKRSAIRTLNSGKKYEAGVAYNAPLNYVTDFTITPNIPESQQQPNLVIFLIDDMGVMDTSVPFMVDENGNPRSCPLNEWYRTPNMERLANQGIRFNSFYAQSVSSPSRASILTGQNSTRHRTTNWIDPASKNTTTYGPTGWNWKGLTKSDITLPYILKSAGYKTIHIGKAHYGPKGSEGEDPKNIGFDANVGGCAIGHPGSYYGKDDYGRGGSHAVPHLEKYHGTDVFLTEALTLEAKREIALAVMQNKPFFLNMCHYAVHAPFLPDKRYINNYKDKSDDAKAFATLIEGMDKSLGDLMDYFEELGVAENTFIIFLGDNGSDSPIGNAQNCATSAPLRGKKGTKYEGGVRVPFIAGWGKNSDITPVQKRTKIDIGSIQLQHGTIMDIFPTLLTIANVDARKEYVHDGYDLHTQLAGLKDTKRSGQVLMHYPHSHNSNYFTTYRNNEWKLIYEYNPKTPTQPTYSLFNTSVDISESNNLFPTESGKIKEMVGEMIEQLDNEGALFPLVDGKELRPIIPD